MFEQFEDTVLGTALTAAEMHAHIKSIYGDASAVRLTSQRSTASGSGMPGEAAVAQLSAPATLPIVDVAAKQVVTQTLTGKKRIRPVTLRCALSLSERRDGCARWLDFGGFQVLALPCCDDMHTAWKLPP